MDEEQITTENNITENLSLEELENSIEELKQCLNSDGTVVLDDDGDNTFSEIAEEKTGTFVRITPDKHEGWLYLAKPKEGTTYSKEDILRILADNDVKTGYIMSNIIAMAKKGIYERSIKVALYKEAQEGVNGHYLYDFDIESIDTKHPKIKEDGSVDYAAMNLLVGVAKDSRICTYQKAEEGREGYLVDGTPLYPAKVVDLPILKGKGFRYNEETGEYFSEIDGKLELKGDNEIIISNVHHIKGDITQLNPRIEFNGDIEIDGNVESGTIIKSTRTITISGVVEAAQIYAGGDVILKRGIQGSNKAKVICNGSVYADFIEHTSVKAGNDIKSNTILNSEVSADGHVVLTGKRGTLVGGYTHGRKGITCVNLGNSVEVKTVAHVGLETRDYLKNQDVKKKDVFLREQLKDILDGMNFILAQKKIRPLTKKEIADLNSMNARKKEYMLELAANQKDEAIINAIVEEARDASIRIEEHVYKGVIIAIDASRMPVNNDTQFMIYQNVNGVIESGVITVV